MRDEICVRATPLPVEGLDPTPKPRRSLKNGDLKWMAVDLPTPTPLFHG